DPRDRHSFPTRRSSDLSHLPHVANSDRRLTVRVPKPQHLPIEVHRPLWYIVWLHLHPTRVKRNHMPAGKVCRNPVVGVVERCLRSEEHTSELQSREKLV